MDGCFEALFELFLGRVFAVFFGLTCCALGLYVRSSATGDLLVTRTLAMLLATTGALCIIGLGLGGGGRRLAVFR